MKKNGDVIWIDPKTGKKCNWKECKNKFTIKGFRKSKWNPSMFDPDKNREVIKEVVFNSYYHECTECGRKIFHLPEDKKKTKESYMHEAYGFNFEDEE